MVLGAEVRLDDDARKVVVVPDAHAHPGYDSQRFAWLGALIERERPSHVVCLGDFADMPALSQYDKGKRGFEGRRYTRDVEATREALRALHGEVRSASPRWLMCLGNHEARIDRATSDAAELEGAIGIDDLGYREHGWECLPYQAVLTLGGVSFSHHFAAGVSGRPIGGLHQAAALLRVLHLSAVVGHSHVYDVSIQTRPDRSRIFGLVAGCYVHQEHHESWSAATEHMWVNGITILEGVRSGWPESWHFVSQSQLAREYVSTRSTTIPTSDAGSVQTEPPYLGPPAVSVGGLDFDDVHDTACEPHVTATAAARIAGVHESTCRKQCRDRGITPAEWLRERGLR